MRWLSLSLGLIPCLGMVELALHQYFARQAPHFEDYAALAPTLLELKQTGVPVVVAPAWAEPLVRQAAPLVFPEAELARADDSASARFLEVSLLGQSSPALDSFPVERTETVGKFRLAWRRNPSPDPVQFDFVSAVERGQAELFTEVDGQQRPCEWSVAPRASTGGLHGHVAYPRSRFECAGGRIAGVTIIDDQQYRPRRCVLVQPPEGGRVVLRFNHVPASARLVGFTGFSYFLERDAELDQIELTVNEAGRQLGAARARGANGWARFELPRSGEPGVVEVNVRRSRPSSDFCFALGAR